MIELYEIPPSPPCRAVKMLAKKLGIELNSHIVDIIKKKEQFQPEFLEINPFHTVPAIVDDGFKLGDSKAIMLYLINKHDPNSTLYPKDPQKRAVVDQMMQSETGTVFPALVGIMRPQLHFGKEPSTEAWDKAKEVLGIFNKILGSRTFSAGNELTVADFSLVASLTTFEVARQTLDEFPNVAAYVNRFAAELSPFYSEINDGPLLQAKGWVNDKMKNK